MANVLVEETSLQNIANSIREKNGTTDTYKPSEMASAISNIETGGGKYKPRFISFHGYYGTDLNEELANLDTSSITSMDNMFYNCREITNLDLSNFDTSNVTNIGYIFSGCAKITNLDLSNFDTSNVTNMSGMFYNCKALTQINLSSFDTSKNIYFGQMFYGCKNISDLNLSNFDFSQAKYIGDILDDCSSLTNLNFGTNLGKSFTRTSNASNHKLDLSTCTLLTHDSLIDVINNLYDLNLTYDVANGGTLYTQSLILGETNIAKLTEDEIAIATAKGWTVS